MQIIADAGKNFIDYDWQIEENPGVPYFLKNAKILAREAKKAGADVVKFQTHCSYDEESKRDKSRYSWISFNETVTPYFEFWRPLKEYCDEIGIEFMTTPMSKGAAIEVNDFVNRWKVSSADITDFELLEYLKKTGKPIILSTGMSTEDQINKTVEFLKGQIEYINYCVSIYPCPVYKINLIRLLELMDSYNLPVGFSDHSLSIEVPAMAVKMGAIAVEKHFTLDRNLKGPDHKVSLLPNEFKEMADLCRLADKQGETLEEEKQHWQNFRINN